MLKLPASAVRLLAASSILLFVLGCGSGSQPSTASAPAVVLTTTSLPGATVGTYYSAAVLAAQGTPPYAFTVTSGLIPPGFSMSSAGVLYGTPTIAGSYSFTVAVTDAKGQRATEPLTLVVAPGTNNPPLITTTTLPSGQVGVGYSATIMAANGATPYAFAVTTGALPAGLTLSSSGVITGTPSTAGTSAFTVTVTDASAQRASATFSITIASATATPVSITTLSLPGGTVGVAYSAAVTAANGTTPYSFAVTSGTLPAGLTLSTTGVLAGTPTTAGTYSFTVTVTDAKSATASAGFSVTIAASSAALSITTPTLPAGTVGVAYSGAIAAAGGTTPYTFAVTSGSLPTGLTLTPTGIVGGTPTASGTFAFTVTVTDAKSAHANQAYSVTIAAANSPVTITTTSLPNATVGTAYSTTIVAANGQPSYTFKLNPGSTLPPGLSFSPVGVLFGTPTASGTYSFTVTVFDTNSAQASATLTLTVAPAAPTVTISTTSLPAATVNAAYSASLAANGGTAPYSFALTSGSLPAGLSLATTGAITGTPTATGASTFTVQVTDAKAQQASATLTLTVVSSSNTLAIASTPLALEIVNTPYSTALQITGGTTPYTATLASGTLPPGVTLSSAGVISGTPTATGTYPITVKVTDASGPVQTASANYTLYVVDATVNVNTTATVVTVPQTFFGIHTSVYDGQLNDTAALPALLATGGITTLRYPGGSYADRYHWAQHSLTPLYVSTAPACSYVAGGSVNDGFLTAQADFGNFIRTVLATGTQPIITINYGTSVADSKGTITAGSQGLLGHCSDPNTAGQPQEAAAWVAYANGSASSTQVIGLDAVGFDWKTVGYWATMRSASPLANDDGFNFLRLGHAAPLGIKYWEVGNEMYYNGWSGNRNYEADLHAPYIYPNGYTGGGYESRDQLPALSPTAYGTNAITFIQAMKAVDPTIQIGVDFASPGATDPIPLNWNPDLANAACGAGMFDIAIIHYYPGTYNAVQPGELLSLPESDLPRQIAGIKGNLAQYCPANASAIKFMLTETSPNGNLAPNFPAPAIGLFALNEYLASLANGVQNIDWLELHNGTYLDTNETPQPAYYGIELAHLLAGVGDSLVQATSSSGTVVAFATLKTNGQKGLLLINASGTAAQSVGVAVAGASLGASATQYSYGVNTTQSGPVLPGSAFAVPGSTFAVTVPAFTAVELVIP